LPFGVIFVLDRHRRQPPAVQQRHELRHETLHCDKIRDNMMHVRHKDMAPACQARQSRPQQRGIVQLERADKVFDNRRRFRGIIVFQLKIHAIVNDLFGNSLHQMKGGAKYFVTKDQSPEDILPLVLVDRMVKREDGGHIVGHASGLHLLQDEQPLLG